MSDWVDVGASGGDIVFRFRGKRFQEFLSIARAFFLVYDPKTKLNGCKPSQAPAVVSALAQAGFGLRPYPGFPEALEKYADFIQKCEEETAKLAESAGLFHYQAQGVSFLKSRKRALLADDMGLGKTIQALVALPKGASVYVVCPAVVKGSWENEIARWRPDFSVYVCKGRKSVRPPAPGEIVILNYELLPDSDAAFAGTADVVVFDEVHYLANSKAVRTKRARVLADSCETVWGLTGTPLQNRPPELWGVLRSLRLEKEAYGSWGNFVLAFGGYPSDLGLEWGKPTENAAKGFSRVSLRRRKSEVMKQIPEKLFRDVPCPTKLKANRKYDGLSILSLPDNFFLEFSTLFADLAKEKLPAALKLVEEYENAGEPLVVFSMHKDPVNTIGERKGWTKITGDLPHEERSRRVVDFQAGKYKGIACTIQAAGVGITLTHASNALFIDRSFVPTQNWQAEDRICRIGQSRGCSYTFLVSQHPIDVLLHDTLHQKRELIENVVDKLEFVTEDVQDIRSLAAQAREFIEKERKKERKGCFLKTGGTGFSPHV